MEVIYVFLIYLIGVFVSLVVMAYVNANLAKHDPFEIELCAASWLFIVMLALSIMAYKAKDFYDWMYRKFLKSSEYKSATSLYNNIEN